MTRNVVLFAVLIYELIGPTLTKWSPHSQSALLAHDRATNDLYIMEEVCHSRTLDHIAYDLPRQ